MPPSHGDRSVELRPMWIIVTLTIALAASLGRADRWKIKPLPALPSAVPLVASRQTDQLRSFGGESLSIPQEVPMPSAVGPALDGGYGSCDGSYDCDFDGRSNGDCGYGWQILPERLIYRSYLAGVTEPRFAAAFNHDQNGDWKWDLVAGGRVGLLRYGTCDCQSSDCDLPQGWQLDIEGAAFIRLTPIADTIDLEGTDYRFGIPLSYGRGQHQFKLAYFHLSSHMGDEYAIRFGALGSRINYSRDAIVLGHSYMATAALRFYYEASWAFQADVSEPWHFQFGCEYSQLAPTGLRGAPFWAVNAQLREENDFGGRAVIQGGWQWNSSSSGRRFRVGVQYYSGYHEKYQFLHTTEQKVGLGVWYDF